MVVQVTSRRPVSSVTGFVLSWPAGAFAERSRGRGRHMTMIAPTRGRNVIRLSKLGIPDDGIVFPEKLCQCGIRDCHVASRPSTRTTTPTSMPSA